MCLLYWGFAIYLYERVLDPPPPPPPPLVNYCKAVQPKVQNYFLESGVKFTGNALYFYQKLFFSRGVMALTPLSYGMSDVNPHLT